MQKDIKVDVEEKVKKILFEKLDIEPEMLKQESVLTDDLGMDSFNAIELSFEVKDHFGVEISNEDFTKIRTVEDIIEYISSRV